MMIDVGAASRDPYAIFRRLAEDEKSFKGGREGNMIVRWPAFLDWLPSSPAKTDLLRIRTVYACASRDGGTRLLHA